MASLQWAHPSTVFRTLFCMVSFISQSTNSCVLYLAWVYLWYFTEPALLWLVGTVMGEVDANSIFHGARTTVVGWHGSGRRWWHIRQPSTAVSYIIRHGVFTGITIISFVHHLVWIVLYFTHLSTAAWYMTWHEVFHQVNPSTVFVSSGMGSHWLNSSINSCSDTIWHGVFQQSNPSAVLYIVWHG